MTPKPGTKFTHKLLEHNPECEVTLKDGAFIMYTTPDGTTHSVYANEFNNIVKVDEDDDRPTSAELHRADKPRPARGRAASEHSTESGARRAAPGASSAG